MSSLRFSIRNALLSKHKVLGRKEYKLAKSRLLKDEYIKETLYGSYQGGSGLLVATNKRVMLLDRRPFFDYVEEADAKSVNHLSYRQEPFMSLLHIKLNNTYFRIKSYNESKIRSIFETIQSVVSPAGELQTFDMPHTVIHNISEEAIVKPLHRRHKKHPAWSPHNPIMMGVMSSSGVRMTED